MGPTYGVTAGHRLGGRWLVELSGGLVTSKEEEVLSAIPADTLPPLGGLRGEFKAVRVGAMVSHLLRQPSSKFNMSLGFGGGLLDWKIVDESLSVKQNFVSALRNGGLFDRRRSRVCDVGQ
jgi:hypothetical protein